MVKGRERTYNPSLTSKSNNLRLVTSKKHFLKKKKDRALNWKPAQFISINKHKFNLPHECKDILYTTNKIGIDDYHMIRVKHTKTASKFLTMNKDILTSILQTNIDAAHK